MKIQFYIIYTICVLFGTSILSLGQDNDLPAFPGAEGHARYVTGGRGGSIYYVTHLNDDSSVGSLRAGVEKSGARIILFKVSGIIHLKKDLKISKDNITIAGQTAPGDGICIADYHVDVSADNVIIRFLRFRMGDVTMQENDALGGRFHKNIIVDHCSMSWSTDECVSFYQNETFTLQWCIVSESLRNSVHEKGNHGYGAIWGGKNASFHHNLLAHHDSRNPRLGEYNGDAFALTDAVDLRNNVIYNWSGNSCYGGEAMNVNIVNCYYKPGPATTKEERIISIDYEKESDKATYKIWGKFYIDGNVLTESSRATADNWTYGVYNQFHSSYDIVSEADKIALKRDTPLPTGVVTNHTAEIAYEKVLAFGGASLSRDSIDIRIIHDVSTGTATYMDGGNGSENGIIDTQSAVGGWCELTSTEAPEDTDKDGMPNEWETANGLDPNSVTDGQLTTVDGKYPNVEVYVNSLVADIVAGQNEGGELINIIAANNVFKQSDRLKSYFNSSTHELNLHNDKIIQKVEVYAINGYLLNSIICNNENVSMFLPEFGNGIYIVRVFNDNQGWLASKFSVTN